MGGGRVPADIRVGGADAFPMNQSQNVIAQGIYMYHFTVVRESLCVRVRIRIRVGIRVGIRVRIFELGDRTS